MKILFTGNYETEYNRNLIIIEGLKDLNVEVVERPVNSKKEFCQNKFSKEVKEADIVYLPSFTHAFVKPLKSFFPTKPIVFDPLISKYLTKVFDYKNVWKYSPRALKNYFKDKTAFSNADIVLADTRAHKDFYIRKFGIRPEKIKVLPIGVSTKHFFPFESKRNDDLIKVGFYGSFAPLQGIDKIIQTANLLKNHENIRFYIIGSGYDFKKVDKIVKEYQLNNIEFEGWLPYNELNNRINDYNICLGIFGNTPKTDLVIPNKIFHYMACRKAVISKNTPAMRELFTHDENILLTKNSPELISEQILMLSEDFYKKDKIAENAHETIIQNYTANYIAESLIRIFKNV